MDEATKRLDAIDRLVSEQLGVPWQPFTETVPDAREKLERIERLVPVAMVSS
jgi:hypothetical protein